MSGFLGVVPKYSRQKYVLRVTSSTTSYIVAVETEHKGTGCFANNEAIFVIIRKWLKFQIRNTNDQWKLPQHQFSIWILCESEVMCSAHWWSSLQITSWSRSDHFCEPVILQKIVSSMESMSLTSIRITQLQFCHSWHLDIAEFWGGSETAITLTMQRKENLIQCEDMVFISRAAASIAATARSYFCGSNRLLN